MHDTLNRSTYKTRFIRITRMNMVFCDKHIPNVILLIILWILDKV